MARTLDVYLHQELAGQLIQDDGGQMVFDYAESWLSNPDTIPLSYSLPLHKEQFNHIECRGFFAGILPEEDKRNIIAKNLGISPNNDFAMLAEIGGECAGAVTFIPVGEVLPKQDHQYRELKDSELATILKTLPRRPLMAGDQGVRLSLAGAQDKIVVCVADGKISIPLGSAPSTHILKPANKRFEGLIYNEAFCMKLADNLGILTAPVSVHQVHGINYLLVTRYDRIKDEEGNLGRIHQEDFCQALGIVPEIKYQKEGGPSLSDCFMLLRNVSTTPVIEIERLLEAVIFNYLIGNNDVHGKNFSILYYGDSVRITPLYDLLSTVYYPELDKNMAMRIGGEYDSDKILPRHFDNMAEETELGKALVRERVLEFSNMMFQILGKTEFNNLVEKKLIELIKARCERVLNLYENTKF